MEYIKTMEEYDCDIGILDYAIESANFEIAMGNEEYLSIQEAFIKKKEETFGAKVKSFIDRIIKFFKDLLDKVKDTFDKFQAMITRKKIKRQTDALASASKAGAKYAAAYAATGVVVGAGFYALIKLGKIARANAAFDEYMKYYGGDTLDPKEQKDFKKQVFASDEVKKATKVRAGDILFYGRWLDEDIRACINLANKARKFAGDKFRGFSHWISERLKMDRAAAKEFQNMSSKFKDGSEIIDIDPEDIRYVS